MKSDYYDELKILLHRRRKNENQFKVVICFLKQKSNWAKFFLEMLVSLHKLADKTYNEKYRSNDIL